MFKNVKYCTKCVMPETVEGQKFDKKGLCITCQAQETKKKVDWDAKRKELDKILKDAKEKSGNNYDCIVPISGGKDSIYQLHVIVKEYGLKPLAVTFHHGWFSKTGWYNLYNCLEKMDIDHVMFTPAPSLVNRIAKRSVEKIGDACYHCHAGVAAFTLQMAVAYNINLIIWGESAAEYGHQGNTYDKYVVFDRDYFTKLSSKLSLDEFKCEYLTDKDLFPFNVPSVEACKNIKGIHLGNYIPWDTEEQVAFAKEKYNWKGRQCGGAYKDYKSVECSMSAIHDFLCYLKRGFGRASIQASQDIRNMEISRDQAIYLVNKHERIEPKYLHYFLEKVTGLKPEEFRNFIEALKCDIIKDINLPADKEWRNIDDEGKPFMKRLIDGEI